MTKLHLFIVLASALSAQRVVAPGQITTVSGDGRTLVTTTGPQTSGNLVKIDANGNHVDSGSASGGNGIVITNAEYNVGTCTTAATISALNGNRQKVTLTNAQTCALSFTQPASGTISIQIKLIQSAAGSFNGAISGGLWPGGIVPTITQTTGAVDIISCYLDGTHVYCAASQDFR